MSSFTSTRWNRRSLRYRPAVLLSHPPRATPPSPLYDLLISSPFPSALSAASLRRVGDFRRLTRGTMKAFREPGLLHRSSLLRRC